MNSISSKVNHSVNIQSAYNSDKQAYNKAMSALKDNSQTIQEQLDQANQRISLLEKEKKQLYLDIDFYKERLSSAERNYESKQKLLQRLHDEKDSEQTVIKSLRD